MALRTEELAKTIVHTLLDPEAARDDVERLSGQAHELQFASVCVLPDHVPAAAGDFLSARPALARA